MPDGFNGFWARVWIQTATFPAQPPTPQPAPPTTAPVTAPATAPASNTTYCPVCLFAWQEQRVGPGFLPDADAEFCSVHQDRLMDAFPDATEAQKVLLRIELHGTQRH